MGKINQVRPQTLDLLLALTDAADTLNKSSRWSILFLFMLSEHRGPRVTASEALHEMTEQKKQPDFNLIGANAPCSCSRDCHHWSENNGISRKLKFERFGWLFIIPLRENI